MAVFKLSFKLNGYFPIYYTYKPAIMKNFCGLVDMTCALQYMLLLNSGFKTWKTLI